MAWVRTMAAALLGRVGAVPALPAAGAGEPPPEPAPLLLDATTRTFWSYGALAPATLVETSAGVGGGDSSARRVAALVRSQEDPPRPAGRPRANPAYSEAVFVEMMRARQYERAFKLLSDDCRRSWGSAERFAARHSSHALNHLLGVEVTEVRFLEEWTDPGGHTTHRDVAELDVRYSFARGAGTTSVERTVHLVGAAGRWRCICYPGGDGTQPAAG